MKAYIILFGLLLSEEVVFCASIDSADDNGSSSGYSNMPSRSEIETSVFEQSIYLDFDELVLLRWNPFEKHIIFEVQAITKGYIGIGFSPSGGMKNSDIALAFFDDQGQPRLLDMYAPDESKPLLDPSQDYVLLSGSRNDTHQTFRFSRKWKTCDDNDRDITLETNHVIWAISDAVPYEENSEFFFNYHGGMKGQKSLLMNSSNIFDVPDGPDIREWTVETPEVAFENGSDTLYHCSLHEFPENAVKTHIIGHRPVVSREHIAHMHHIILYECSFGDMVDGRLFSNHKGSPCYRKDFPRAWYLCRNSIILWAIGSSGYMLPDKMGMPVEPGNPTFFMMESHFDNTELLPNAKGKGALTVYYTTKLRQHDAGNLAVGQTVSTWQVIPPGQKEWESRAYCGGDCFQDAIFPEGGINVTSVAHHTHYLGRRVLTQLYRDGKELEPLTRDDFYDFRYQQQVKLPEERNVRNGDVIVTTCVYDSTKRTKATFGGLGSTEEMCLIFLYYYPRINIHTCLSSASKQAFERTYDIELSVNKQRNISFSTGLTPVSVAEGKDQGLSFTQFMSKEERYDKNSIKSLQKVSTTGEYEYLCLLDGKSKKKRRKGVNYPVKLENMKPKKEICEN